MRILYRILDWCQRRNADVFFQQMWGNVAWNTFPQWKDDPVRRVHSGPLSMNDFAEGVATLVDTWDRKGKRLLDRFTPHANVYYLYGLLSRFTAKHSSVLSCRVERGKGGRTGRFPGRGPS
jgi:hypothetical protein